MVYKRSKLLALLGFTIVTAVPPPVASCEEDEAGGVEQSAPRTEGRPNQAGQDRDEAEPQPDRAAPRPSLQSIADVLSVIQEDVLPLAEVRGQPEQYTRDVIESLIEKFRQLEGRTIEMPVQLRSISRSYALPIAEGKRGVGYPREYLQRLGVLEIYEDTRRGYATRWHPPGAYKGWINVWPTKHLGVGWFVTGRVFFDRERRPPEVVDGGTYLVQGKVQMFGLNRWTRTRGAEQSPLLDLHLLIKEARIIRHVDPPFDPQGPDADALLLSLIDEKSLPPEPGRHDYENYTDEQIARIQERFDPMVYHNVRMRVKFPDPVRRDQGQVIGEWHIPGEYDTKTIPMVKSAGIDWRLKGQVVFNELKGGLISPGEDYILNGVVREIRVQAKRNMIEVTVDVEPALVEEITPDKF